MQEMLIHLQINGHKNITKIKLVIKLYKNSNLILTTSLSKLMILAYLALTASRARTAESARSCRDAVRVWALFSAARSPTTDIFSFTTFTTAAATASSQ